MVCAHLSSGILASTPMPAVIREAQLPSSPTQGPLPPIIAEPED